jgi:exodeoxyribonuclease VII small subunit
MADAQKEPTFEEALAQLEAIVTSIEQGKIGLQDAIVQYERGMKLIQHCRSVLGDAEAKIQQLQLGADGKLTPAPMERGD